MNIGNGVSECTYIYHTTPLYHSKQLEGISRYDLGREEFMKKVWEWKNVYGNRITSQIRFLGASVDWSRGYILHIHTYIHTYSA